jgi:hypothetical protein
MSCLANESLLETIFEEVLEEYYHAFNAGDLSQEDLDRITYQRFEDCSR